MSHVLHDADAPAAATIGFDDWLKAVTCTPDWYRSEVESFALMADG